ncbi:sensor histidine kinase [Alteraurantiacibacter buctensis]|nr:histidine kinase dimerization/phosphoacceptor domain -containing protein [Alteraurantiacibacter buctensis]
MDGGFVYLLQRVFRRLPLAGGRPLLAVPAGLAITAVAFALRMALDSELPSGFPYVTFFPAVVISAVLFGLWGGISSAVLGFLLARWYFVAPVGSLSMAGGAGWAMGLYVFVVVVDIIAIHSAQVAMGSLDRERQRNRDLAESRQLLFHELQHRVGNNLQMVGSLLSLQGRRVADGPAREAVAEAARRVQLVGKIQRTLYEPEGSQRSLSVMLEELVRDIVASGSDGTVSVRMDVQHDAVIGAEQSIPVALIVGEAVSNALEHGFTPGEGGTITVAVAGHRLDGAGGLRITVSDDGRGLTEGFTLEGSTSLGLRIARSLAGSLGGSFVVVRADGAGGGTLATLDFPLTATA